MPIDLFASPRSKFWLTGFLVLLLFALALFLKFARLEPRKISGTERTLSYTLTVRNKGNSLLKNKELTIFSPVTLTSHQQVKNIAASLPFSSTSDKFGNTNLHFSLTIPPYGNQVIKIDVKLVTANEGAPLGDDESHFLQEEKFIELNDTGVKRIFGEITSQTTPVTAKSIFVWIVSHLSKAPYTLEDRGAAVAAQGLRGDCTEFSYLFVALARLAKIPARLVSGFVLAENEKIRAGNYHNWVEFYENGIWQIADPFNDKFKSNEEDYIVFRIYSSSTLSPLNSAQRFIAGDPNLEVELD